jgi:transposase
MDNFISLLPQLTKYNQAILNMRYAEKKTIKEIANLLNRSIASVHTVISRQRKKNPAIFPVFQLTDTPKFRKYHEKRKIKAGGYCNYFQNLQEV